MIMGLLGWMGSRWRDWDSFWRKYFFGQIVDATLFRQIKVVPIYLSIFPALTKFAVTYGHISATIWAASWR